MARRARSSGAGSLRPVVGAPGRLGSRLVLIE